MKSSRSFFQCKILFPEKNEVNMKKKKKITTTYIQKGESEDLSFPLLAKSS